MAEEIELKLSIATADQALLRSHPLLAQLRQGEVSRQLLTNIYFDTPDLELHQQRVALRIRRKGERYIQTLKTQGSTRGGLHSRLEWEWPVQQPELDLQLLPEQVLPPAIDPRRLQPVFRTDFERTAWQLQFAHNDRQAEIELVLDAGAAIVERPDAPERRDPISEIELELKRGDAGLLYELALQLAADLPLRITRISKAQRGYRLLNPFASQPNPPTAIDAQQPLQLQQLLEQYQQWIETFLFAPEMEALRQLERSLAQIAPLASALSPPEPKCTEVLLRTHRRLQPLLTDTGTGGASLPAERRLQEAKTLLQDRALCRGLLQLSYRGFCLAAEDQAQST